jgi:hypothetical protein
MNKTNLIKAGFVLLGAFLGVAIKGYRDARTPAA